MTWRVALLALDDPAHRGHRARDPRRGRRPRRLPRDGRLSSRVLILVGASAAYVGTRRRAGRHGSRRGRRLADQLRVVAAARDFRLLLATFVVQALAIGAMLAGVDYVAAQVLERRRVDGAVRLLRRARRCCSRRCGRGWARGSARARLLAASVVLAVGALLLVSRRWCRPVVVYRGRPRWSASATPGRRCSRWRCCPTSPPSTRPHRRKPGRRLHRRLDGRRDARAGPRAGRVRAGAGARRLRLLDRAATSRSRRRPSPRSRSASRWCPPLLVLLSAWWLRRYRLDRRRPPRGTRTDDDRRPRPSSRRCARDDLPTHGGRTLAYVYDCGLADVDAVGRQALASYGATNGLDPTAFPSLLRMENELVGFAADLLDAPADARRVGDLRRHRVVPARRADRPRRPPRGRAAEMVLPTTAHAAFHKAAHYFGVARGRRAGRRRLPRRPGRHGRGDRRRARCWSWPRAPSYAHGVVDPVAEIAALAAERGIRCHVDACIGGWVLPYAAPARPRRAAVDVRGRGRHEHLGRPAQVRLHAQGRLAAAAPHARAAPAQFFACADWPGYTMLNSTMQSTSPAARSPRPGRWCSTIGDDGYRELARAGARRRRPARSPGRASVTALHVVAAARLDAGRAGDRRRRCDVFTLADEMRRAAGTSSRSCPSPAARRRCT